jgi:hypothetical protein
MKSVVTAAFLLALGLNQASAQAQPAGQSCPGAPTHAALGVAGAAKDNIIHDVKVDAGTGHTVSAGGFGHAICSAESTKIAAALPTTHPTGPTP